MNCVVLRGGVSIMADALRLAWDLEAKGATFRLEFPAADRKTVNA